MTIAALPTPPSTASPTTFAAQMDAFLAALPAFVTQANALAVTMTAVAAGGAVSLQYTFDTATTDADPGAGKLRLSSATQNAATVLRLNTTGADGSALAGVIDTFTLSTSTAKGYLMVRKATDATKWLLFSVSALASPVGYRNVTIAPLASSAASPFVAADPLLVDFTPTGDKGTTGTTGAAGLGALAPVTVTLTTQTAAAGSRYILTNVAATTVTAPATPADGDEFAVIPANGLLTNVVDFGTAVLQGPTGTLTGLVTLDTGPLYVRYVFAITKWVLL